MKTEDNDKPIEIFSGNNWQTGIIKSLLENADIECFLYDEITGTLSPWWTAPGGAGSIRVFIAEHDYEAAKQIVDEYQQNSTEAS